jgi:hypothetical protein
MGKPNNQECSHLDNSSRATSPASHGVTTTAKHTSDQAGQVESAPTPPSSAWVDEFKEMVDKQNVAASNHSSSISNVSPASDATGVASDALGSKPVKAAAGPEWCARGLALPRPGQPGGVAHAALEFLQGLIRGGSIGFASKAALGLAFAALKGYKYVTYKCLVFD